VQVDFLRKLIYLQSEGTSVKTLSRNSPCWPGSKVVGMMT